MMKPAWRPCSIHGQADTTISGPPCCTGIGPSVPSGELKRRGSPNNCSGRSTPSYPNSCYSYSQFCDCYKSWCQLQKRSMRQIQGRGKSSLSTTAGLSVPIASLPPRGGPSGSGSLSPLWCVQLHLCRGYLVTQSLPDWLPEAMSVPLSFRRFLHRHC